MKCFLICFVLFLTMATSCFASITTEVFKCGQLRASWFRTVDRDITFSVEIWSSDRTPVQFGANLVVTPVTTSEATVMSWVTDAWVVRHESEGSVLTVHDLIITEYADENLDRVVQISRTLDGVTYSAGCKKVDS